MVFQSFIIESVGSVKCGQTDVGRRLKAIHVSLLLSVPCSCLHSANEIVVCPVLTWSGKHLCGLPCWLAEHFLWQCDCPPF